MADSSRLQRLLNPCLLHLQKMELELKCPACLKLLDNPMLLPCNHICCSSCVINPVQNLCPACKMPLLNEEPRVIPHVETIVTIFKSMNASFATLVKLGFEIGGRTYAETSVVYKTGTGDKLPDGKVSKDSGDRTNYSCNTRLAACPNGGEPCSPLSFGDLKDSDDDSNNSGNDHKLPSNACCKRKADAAEITQSPIEPTSENPSLSRRAHSESSHQNASKVGVDPSNVGSTQDLKRPKLESQLYDSATKSCHNSVIKDNENIAAPFPMSNSLQMPCVFCNSSTESKFTGPMLHYDATGNPVDNSKALQPSIWHVHEKCIEWAPQVYFDGDIAKNIEGEVLRASKIKCSKCGQKGAALGCYAKSCRKSFHIPCSLQVSGCRWDIDNFLMLCPVHFSKKFPSDRSSSQRKIKSTESSIPLDHSKPRKDTAVERSNENLWMGDLDVTRGWVLCGSALSSLENNLLSKFAKMTGTSISRDWRSNVTHVIASTDELGACSRTLKYLMAILSGKWILRIEWIKACLEAKHLVDEESYEINHDIHGCFDGPKNGRTRIMEKAPPLFNGMSFYFCGHFKLSYKGYLEDLILAAGGKILKETSSFNCDSNSIISMSYVVYNLDPPEECDLADQVGAIKSRLEEAEAIATASGSQVVAHTWVLDSIAACRLQPLVS